MVNAVAFEKRKKRRVETIAVGEQRLALRDSRAAFPETPLEKARLLKLAPSRKVQLVVLNQIRKVWPERVSAVPWQRQSCGDIKADYIRSD